jgi:hypothetical protein
MKKEAALGAIMVAYTMKKRLLIISGAIMLAIGFMGAIPFGSIVINEAEQQELNPTTQRPEPIFFGIISPLYAENSVYDYRCCWVFIISAWRLYASRRRIKAATMMTRTMASA